MTHWGGAAPYRYQCDARVWFRLQAVGSQYVAHKARPCSNRASVSSVVTKRRYCRAHWQQCVERLPIGRGKAL